MALSNELLVRIYTDMVRTRAIDEQFIISNQRAKMPTAWHSGIGQEGIVAVIAQLRPDDYATYTHRGAYVWIGKGMTMKEIMAEFYGKATGCAKGKGGTHIARPSLGIFGRSGTQGGHFPMAAGMGIAAQMSRQGQVVVSCAGDGCYTRGTVHESLNSASVWKLPIIWLLENNGLSMQVGLDKTWAIQGDLSVIANSYGMPGVTVDGNDAVAVAEAAQELIQRARNGEGPSLLELKTYRIRGHMEGDPMTYRTREEIDMWRQKDPIRRFEQYLASKGVLAQEQLAKITKDAEQEAIEAEKFADESPFPAPEEAFEDMYAP